MLFQIQVVVALALLGTAFGQRPNFIVMQPDDMEFFEPWIPPPHADNEPAFAFPASSLPHLERLRQGSVQMTQAYTASSSCAPSRFSTITGRYASRSGFSRALSANEDVTEVTVPTTRIEDASDQCTEGNVATLLQKNGYRTGIVGSKCGLQSWQEQCSNYSSHAFCLLILTNVVLLHNTQSGTCLTSLAMLRLATPTFKKE